MRPVLLVFAALLGACGPQLKIIDAAIAKPSHLAFQLSLLDGNGKPVEGLAAERWQTFEDGQAVPRGESRPTLLDPARATAQYTLLLVDMSGAVLGSGVLAQLIDGATTFAERVARTQKLAVYAFDGRAEIQPIMPFSFGAPPSSATIKTLGAFQTRDPSANLNGAVLEALLLLRTQMETSEPPFRTGSLVVFTNGRDRAHRVAREDLMRALDGLKASMRVYAVGVGADLDSWEVRAVGRAGAVIAKTPPEVPAAFADLAERIDAAARSTYVISLCSPSRAGDHDLHLEVALPDGRAGATYRFDADHFGPDCDPRAHPAFGGRRSRP